MAVLRILAGVSIALLLYEGWTLATSVVAPLLGNPNILQTDFHYYYEAAIRFRADSSKLYLPTDDVIAGFAYPPPAIVPFVLLSSLPLGVAFLMLTIASYAAILGSVWMWLRYMTARGYDIDSATSVAITLIAVALGPTYMNAIFGQVNAFVLECSVGLIVLGALRPIQAGAMLAAGVWLKIYPALAVAAVAWDSRLWRAVAYAGIAAAAIVIIALPIVPLNAYASFADVLTTRADKTAVHITNQSLIAFVERFSVPPQRFLNWTGEQAITASAMTRALSAVFGAGALVWLYVSARRGAAVHSGAALIALAAVVAPLGWGHTFVLVLPLVVTHLVCARHAGALVQVAVALCVVALMIPAGRRFGWIEQWPAWAQNIAYSRYLIVTVLLIAVAPRAAPRLAVPQASSTAAPAIS